RPDKVFRLTSHGLAGDCLYQTEHVLGAMIDLTHQKLDLLLMRFSHRNILNHEDKIVDGPIALAYAAGSLPAPHNPAVLAHVTLLDVIGFDLSLAHKFRLSNVGRKIIRMGDLPERPGTKFIDRMAEEA